VKEDPVVIRQVPMVEPSATGKSLVKGFAVKSGCGVFVELVGRIGVEQFEGMA
jgi:hypothetical protein